AFHVFHTSCLIHWILLCEVEIANQSTSSKVRRRSRRKNAAKCNGQDGQMKALSTQIHSVFCQECQGTGAFIDGDDLEKPNLPLSQSMHIEGANFPTRIFAQDSFVFSASLSPCKTDRSKRTTLGGCWPKALRCLS
ncbi:Leucine-rich repeat protein kinase family protein, partial [Prunus dulcis]